MNDDLDYIFSHYREAAVKLGDLYEFNFQEQPASQFRRKWRQFGIGLSVLQAVTDARESNRQHAGELELLISLGRFERLSEQLHDATKSLALCSGMDDYKRAGKSSQSRFCVWQERRLLDRIYSQFRESGSLDRRRINRLLDRLGQRLKRSGVKSFVTWSDARFIDRAIVIACRRVGIRSAVLQHGIYLAHTADPCFIGGEKTSDTLVWGNHFGKMFRENGVHRDQIHVVGYPYTLPVQSIQTERPRQQVVIVGQDFDRIGGAHQTTKWAFTNAATIAAKKAGLRVLYRMHPAESTSWLQAQFPDLEVVDESLEATLARDAAFVGLSSTVLVEAALRGKQSIQVIVPGYEVESFEAFGVGITVQIGEIETTFANWRSQRLNVATVSDLYIDCRGDICQRILSVLRENKNSAQE
jgi:hypothetical protein